jgi:hypothetical protein
VSKIWNAFSSDGAFSLLISVFSDFIRENVFLMYSF